jgi:hypothetical protein
VLGGRLYGASFVFQSSEERPVEAGRAIAVQNAFGDVTVRAGEAGKVAVALRKVVFRPKEEEARAFAERLRIVVREESGRLVVTTNRDDLDRERPGGRQVGFETHLELTVPADTPLTVHTEHGGIDASGVAQADLAGSFEGVKAEHIAGALKVEVHHGGAQVREVGGTLTLTGKHGDVLAEDVQGIVSIEREHGDVKLARVGPTTVSTTHGGVEVDGVVGDLEARVEHGGVEAEHVAGRAVVSSSYDGITVRHVGGDARLRAEHGGVEAEDVLGALFAEASFAGVRLLRIGKDADVTVSHGGVDGRALAGAVRVKSSGDDVTLDGFAAAVDVDAERGSVDLSPAGPITHQVTVRAQHGGITLRVPSGSDLTLEADARPGDLDVDLPDFVVERKDETGTSGRLGKGGVSVKLDASHGDVHVRHSARGDGEAEEARDGGAAATPPPAPPVISAPRAPRAPRAPATPHPSPAASPES